MLGLSLGVIINQTPRVVADPGPRDHYHPDALKASWGSLAVGLLALPSLCLNALAGQATRVLRWRLISSCELAAGLLSLCGFIVS